MKTDCISQLQGAGGFDLWSTEVIAQSVGQAEDLWEMLFPTVMMGNDRAVRSAWVCGKEAVNKAE